MFNRLDKFLVVTTNNLGVLEAVSELIYLELKCAYLIQIETFPNMTLYRIYIDMPEDFDDNAIKIISKDLEARHMKLMKES